MRDVRLTEIMSRPPVTVAEECDLASAAELMLRERIGSLLVVDGAGELAGILTESDFAAKRARIPFSTFELPKVLGEWLGREGIERVYEEARRRRVGEVMSRPVRTVPEDGSLSDVLRLMLERQIKHVPVVRDGHPVGVIARHDLLKLLLEQLES